MKTVQIISLIPAVAGMRMDSRKWSQFNIHEHDQQQGESENYAEDQKYYRHVNVHNGHGKPQGAVQINPNNANKGNIVKTVMHGGLLAASVLDGAHNRQARDTAACTLHNGDRFVNKNAFIRQNAICDNEFLIPGGVATYIIPKDKKKPGSSTFKIECNNSEEAIVNLVATEGQFNWQGEKISPDDLCAEIKAKRIAQKNAKKAQKNAKKTKKITKKNAPTVNPPTVNPNPTAPVDDEDNNDDGVNDDGSGSGNGFTTKPQVQVTTKPQPAKIPVPEDKDGKGPMGADGLLKKPETVQSCLPVDFRAWDAKKMSGKKEDWMVVPPYVKKRCQYHRVGGNPINTSGFALYEYGPEKYVCLSKKTKDQILEDVHETQTKCDNPRSFIIF